jgi:hypothetical protein
LTIFECSFASAVALGVHCTHLTAERRQHNSRFFDEAVAPGKIQLMNDIEYATRWRTLAAQLHELERNAGIGDIASSRRDAPLLSSGSAQELNSEEPSGEPPANPYPGPLDAKQRQEVRALYFGVSHSALRRSLIAKHRELDLFERTGTRTRLEDARRHLESLRRRPSEGWWIAAIVGATLVIVGYELFAMLGAIAAGVAALVVGNGIEQSARRRYEQAVAFAEEDLSAAVAAAAAAEQSRNLFSERESATGQADEALHAADAISVRSH